MANPLLPPELLGRLEQFQLLARRFSKSVAKGERRSRSRGQSVEFADHRNYSHGDDFRYLDWNLFGRLDRLFIKLYEEERELPVTLILDASESMAFGSPRKFDYARQVAAAIPENPHEAAIRSSLRAVRGRKSSLRFFQNLSTITCGGFFNINEALHRVALESKQTGVVIVLSDFLDPDGYENGLKSLISRGFHVNAVQLLAREEIDPQLSGELKVVDSESNAEVEVTFGKYRLDTYRKTVEGFCQRMREYCTARGVNYFRAITDQPLEQLLLKQLREAEIWK